MTSNEFEVLKDNMFLTMPSRQVFLSPDIAANLSPTPVPSIQNFRVLRVILQIDTSTCPKHPPTYSLGGYHQIGHREQFLH